MKHIALPSLGFPISLELSTLRRVGLGRWTARLVGLALLGGFLALRAWDPVPVQTVRLKIFDLYQLLRPRSVSFYPVVIVDIDEDALAAQGQWPWPRDLIADMTRKAAFKKALNAAKPGSLKNLETALGSSLGRDQLDAGESHLRGGEVGKWTSQLSEEDLRFVGARLNAYGLDLAGFRTEPAK